MIRTIATAVAAVSILGAAGTALAADITGVWATPSDNGKVRIAACGEGICGRLIDADQIRANPDQTDQYNKDRSKRSRKVKNMPLFQNYTGGPTEWEGGAIYDPKTGDTGRSGKLKLMGDRLEVKGCVAFICRTQHWKRVG